MCDDMGDGLVHQDVATEVLVFMVVGLQGLQTNFLLPNQMPVIRESGGSVHVSKEGHGCSIRVVCPCK